MTENRKEKRVYTNNDSCHNPLDKMTWIFIPFQLE